MSPTEQAADSTLDEARARFRETAERLAVHLRWLSLGVIPILAYASDRVVRSPWFEVVCLAGLVYNWIVRRGLAGGRRTPAFSYGTAIVDSLFLTLMSALSGGIDSVLTIYPILAMASVCMRLRLLPSIGMGVLYTFELTLLAWLSGDVWHGELPVKIAYVFLAIVFVAPLVQEARDRFAEVLSGHEAQRTLLHRLLRTGEDERRRIASELHDRGGGALFSMLHGLRRLREIVPSEGSRAAASEVDHLIQVTEATVHDLRIMLADLRPRLLDDLGLAEALRELLSRERALTGLPVSFHCQAEVLPDAERALALYRIAQEAFTNIRRHAHARSANVELARDDRGWSLAIEDDGAGLNGRRTGLGMQTMRERVEALGGHLEIASRNGSGTRVVAWVPGELPGEKNGDSSLSR
jgi:signal transduction histidine kinase